jgi:hypothetical protein
MINWPPDLVREIARRRCVVFVGAGVSMQCTNAGGIGPKSWHELLTAAVGRIAGAGANARKKEINGLLKAGDYPTACEVIRDRLGTHEFHTFLQDELLTPNFQPAPIHDTLIQLGSRIYATPNFDKILENKAGSVPATAFKIKNYYDNDVAVAARSNDPVILKVHGTIDAPDRLIFTRGDYTRARNEHWTFYAVLEALSVTHSFLFIGCGLSDPDIRLVLEDYAFMHKWAAPHYFVMKNSTVPSSIIPAIERNLNLKILGYSGAHSQLKPELDELVTRVNDARTVMQTDRSW